MNKNFEGAEKVVDAWIGFRDRCGHYNGIKEDSEDQCRHPDMNNAGGCGTWCTLEDCPLLKAAAEHAGVSG